MVWSYLAQSDFGHHILDKDIYLYIHSISKDGNSTLQAKGRNIGLLGPSLLYRVKVSIQWGTKPFQCFLLLERIACIIGNKILKIPNKICNTP